MLKEAREVALSLTGHLCHLAVSYGPPIVALYLLDQGDLLEPELFAVIVPVSIAWLFIVSWLTNKWSDWGTVEEEPTESLLKGRFNPEHAARHKAEPVTTVRLTLRERVSQHLILVMSLLVLTGACTTATYYELNDQYERCIVRNMPGTPDMGVKLVHDACRELAR